MLMIRTLLKLIFTVSRGKRLDKQIRSNRNKINKMTIEILYLEREEGALKDAIDAYQKQEQALRTALKDLKNADI